MSDPIADMLTRIRNANTAKHDTVDVPASKMKIAIADILYKEGYIKKYDIEEIGGFKSIHITLKYGADKNVKIISDTPITAASGQYCILYSSNYEVCFGCGEILAHSKCMEI